MKKNFLLLITASLFVVSSCSDTNIIFTPSDSSESSANITTDITTSENVTSDVTSNTSINSLPSSDSSTINSSESSLEDTSSNEKQNYYQPDQLKYTFREINSNLGYNTSNSVGEQKMLVIPVQLSNAPTWTDDMLSRLEKAFFGATEETSYESVSSYYYKSSYGNLSLSGEVYPVLKVNKTVSEIDKYGSYGPDQIFPYFYNNADSDKLVEYDVDGDGFIDNAIFIYSNDYSTTDGSAYWAWCSWTNYKSNLTKPTINNYMWASYEFMNEKYADSYRSNYPEAHTYIHETGHLLGLDDYYCYDSKNSWDCAGKLEMQSYNVGDQNIFSKMALGWVKPYVVTGSTKIKLKTSASYPQAILINNDWNGSAFDEYILIEYYTPTGLNKQDYDHKYGSREKMYGYNGLRIYHIDARLINMNIVNQAYNFIEYTDEISSKYYTFVGASNSYSYSYLPSKYKSVYRYVHLLDQAGNNRINNGLGGSITTSSALWKGTRVFKPSSTFFANGTKFNDGTEIGYQVSVSSLTDEDCIVSIDALA